MTAHHALHVLGITGIGAFDNSLRRVAVYANAL